jgi:hypothetical protein
MRRLLIHLAVAIFAFVVGVTTAAVFGVQLFAPRAKRFERMYVAPPQLPEEPRCPNARRLRELPPPPKPPAPPAAVNPPKETRITIRRVEGTNTQGVEVQTEKKLAR